MREHRVTLPQLALLAGTRGLLGLGVGLLLGGRLSEGHRHALGITLLVAGALSTVPVAYLMFKRTKPPAPMTSRPKVNNGAARLMH